MLFERRLRIISMAVRSLVRGRALDRELDDELSWHLDHLIEANVARGLSPEAARREALVAMGGLQQRREECRDRRFGRIVEQWVQDVRYALRALGHSPTFALAAIATLTLGIGASVAVFTVVNGVLLRPLPFPDPGRLFLVAMSPQDAFLNQPMLSDHNYVALRSQPHPFSSLATFSTFDGSLVGAGDPVIVKVGNVTTEFFDVLAVRPALGRTFTDRDAQSGAEPTLVLSHSLWRTRYEADASAVGREVTLNGVR